MLKNRLDDYDVDGWTQFYAQNPGVHRSVGADGADNSGGDSGGDGDGGDSGAGDTGAGDGGDQSGGDSGGDDWRAAFAGGDEKRLSQLQRFVKPEDLGKSYFDAQAKITSGELLKPLPEDASEDDVKLYREQQGIPEESKGYLDSLPDGMVIGEEDLPVVEFFANELHAANTPPQFVHAMIAAYDKFMTEEIEARETADGELATEIEDSFRDEWGSDYRVNKNLIEKQMARSFGEGSQDTIMKARLPDGTPLMSCPEFLRGMIELARTVNPAGHLIAADGDVGQSIDDEIGKIEKLMRTDRKAYNADAKMQERYRMLLQARIDRNARGQAA